MPADIGYDWSALTPEQQREVVKKSGRVRTSQDMNRFMAAAQADPAVGDALLEQMKPANDPPPNTAVLDDRQRITPPKVGTQAGPPPDGLPVTREVPTDNPTPGKAPELSPLEFDKRFAGTGGPGMTQGYPIDDDQLMQMIMRRRTMMNGGEPPLQGDIAYDIGMMNQR